MTWADVRFVVSLVSCMAATVTAAAAAPAVDEIVMTAEPGSATAVTRPVRLTEIADGAEDTYSSVPGTGTARPPSVASTRSWAVVPGRGSISPSPFSTCSWTAGRAPGPAAADLPAALPPAAASPAAAANLVPRRAAGGTSGYPGDRRSQYGDDRDDH